MATQTFGRPVRLLLLCLLGFYGAPLLADEHTPRGREASEPAHKWPTDAAAREGMAQVARLLAAHQHREGAGQLSPQVYAELAAQVDSLLARTLARCQLAPDSDQAFHEIIMDMNRGVDLLRSPKPGVQRAGTLALAQALKNYGSYFHHPGWAIPPADH